MTKPSVNPGGRCCATAIGAGKSGPSPLSTVASARVPPAPAAMATKRVAGWIGAVDEKRFHESGSLVAHLSCALIE